MIAIGSIRVLPAFTGTIDVHDLDFEPTRVVLDAGTPSAGFPTALSFGTFSADKAHVPDFPQKSFGAQYINAGVNTTRGDATANVRPCNYGVPVARCEASVSSLFPDGFRLSITVNQLVENCIVQWWATDGVGAPPPAPIPLPP